MLILLNAFIAVYVRKCFYKLLKQDAPANQISGWVATILLDLGGLDVDRFPSRITLARFIGEMGIAADHQASLELLGAEDSALYHDGIKRIQTHLCFHSLNIR